jgi:hypothetical protein
MSNEQLECDAVTGKTGKLEAEKNGWRNRMNQPVTITVLSALRHNRIPAAFGRAVSGPKRRESAQ